mmetsp:Transcript_38285/g.88490  ORF Transcript_38285/g.88490 Transcript_38285/m.88490 type:complete len:200 (+) Transcript_38285:931-1530(+)
MFASIDLAVALIAFCALTMASPSSAHSSSVGFSTASTGSANFSTLATSASALSTLPISSARASLPLRSLSPKVDAFLFFISSSLAVFKRPCSLLMAPAAAGPLTSFCLFVSCFLASWTASRASFSTSPTFSIASLMASSVTWFKSSEKTLATSAWAFTLFSATLMPSTTSAIRAFSFLSAVSFLKSATFLPQASVRWLS